MRIESKTLWSKAQTGRKSDTVEYRLVEDGECYGTYRNRKAALAELARLEAIPATLHAFGPYTARRDFDCSGTIYAIDDATSGRTQYFVGTDAFDRFTARLTDLLRTATPIFANVA